MQIELQLAEAAGWRALLTQAQTDARIFLPESLEQYVVGLLYRRLGGSMQDRGDATLRFARALVAHGASASGQALAAVGDHCLLFSGLFTDHAMRQGVPVTFFVQSGRQAYLDHAARLNGTERELYRALAAEFVRVLDVLLTLRELIEPGAGLDGLNAYQLWRETGSLRGWQVLRSLTPALPAGATTALQ